MFRLVLGIFCPLMLLAQTATLQGVITDPSGEVVPEASVTAILESTGAALKALTGPDGRYRLPALPVGIYTIRCERTGFKVAEIHQVPLSLNQTLEQKINLSLLDADISIDVKEQAEALNTTAAT